MTPIPAPPIRATATNRIPSQPELQEIEDLIPESLKFRKGKGGLKVAPTNGGVIVIMFNDKDLQRRFNTEAKNWIRDTLTERFPHISTAAVFGREGERERMAIGIRSRLVQVYDKPDGEVLGLESLDNDGKRIIPDDPRSINPANHKSVPRHITWVTLTDPPRRHILMSENSFHFNDSLKRPDEVFISYEISQSELNSISEVKTVDGRKVRVEKLPKVSYKDLDRVEARNLRMHVGDPNLEISGPSAEKHFSKTLVYLQGVLETLISPLNPPALTPSGKVYMSARDVYMSHSFLRLSSSGASAVRWVKNMAALATEESLGEVIPKLEDNSVISFSVEFELNNKGEWIIVKSNADIYGRLSKSLKGIADSLRRHVKPNTISTLLEFLNRRK